jgi:hypothetical protein
MCLSYAASYCLWFAAMAVRAEARKLAGRGTDQEASDKAQQAAVLQGEAAAAVRKALRLHPYAAHLPTLLLEMLGGKDRSRDRTFRR